MAIKCNNGIEIIIEESELYVKVIIGNKTWYWSKDTGKFDGTSFDWKRDQLYPCFSSTLY